jgi:glycerol-1-phosphate dehydrogenase [NAD(P)+]
MPLGLRSAYERFGLPSHPADLGLTTELLIDAVINAPQTRPSRYTILNEIDLSRTSVADLVDRAFHE